MREISILGLFALLFLGWAISYDRKKFPFRTVIWGLGLQFLFAVTILIEGIWGFVGMAALVLLFIYFVFRNKAPDTGSEKPNYLLPMLAFAIFTAAFYGLGRAVGAAAVMSWMIILVFLLVLNSRSIKKMQLQPWGYAAFFSAGLSYLILTETNGKLIFDGITKKVENFLALSDYGSAFLFGNLVNKEWFFTGSEVFPGFGFQFAFKVLPTIIFFGGFMGVLYYLGIMQLVIESLSKFVRWTIGTSGAETLSCTSNVFVGQTEAPLLIKPFLDKMTRSELLTVMVGGFATIAGGVLAGYINMGISAGHLIAASVMSAPAALVFGKIILPESEHSQTAGDVPLPQIAVGENILEAASNGISDGLRLAMNVGAMLIGFIALIAVLDVLFNWVDGLVDGKLLGGEYVKYAITGSSPVAGEFVGIFPGSLQTLFGTLLRPLAFLMGVPWQDAAAVGNLLGVKLSLNEFVAYGSLGTYINNGSISPRAAIIATYALCGFANFSSIGIQIGGISALAPERRPVLSQIALRAMFGGAFASWTTATFAGMMLD